MNYFDRYKDKQFLVDLGVKGWFYPQFRDEREAQDILNAANEVYNDRLSK